MLYVKFMISIDKVFNDFMKNVFHSVLAYIHCTIKLKRYFIRNFKNSILVLKYEACKKYFELQKSFENWVFRILSKRDKPQMELIVFLYIQLTHGRIRTSTFPLIQSPIHSSIFSNPNGGETCIPKITIFARNV